MMCLWASYKKKNMKKYSFCILKINEERSRIPSWIGTGTDPYPLVKVRIRGSESALKCHGSPTLGNRSMMVPGDTVAGPPARCGGQRGLHVTPPLGVLVRPVPAQPTERRRLQTGKYVMLAPIKETTDGIAVGGVPASVVNPDQLCSTGWQRYFRNDFNASPSR
jgi:hypothetical protein